MNRKLNTGLVMLGSGLLLLAVSGANFDLIARAARATLAGRPTQILLASILLLGIMGSLLKQTGALQRMIDNLERLLGDLRFLTAVLPALIGILTVPGGAVFSAPLVEQCGNKAGLDSDRQAAINLWFRHALYFAYPLFPSVILASELAGVSVLTFFFYNISLTAAGLLSAFLILFRGVPGKVVSAQGDAGGNYTRNLTGFMASAAPLITVLVLVIAFELIFPAALAAGCAVALAGGIPLKPGFGAALFSRVKTMLLPSLKPDLALVVLGIMFFKQSLDYSGTTEKMAETLLDWGLPLLLLMFFFPAVIGLLTGDNAASVAIVFPLFLPLLEPEASLFPAFVAFLYFSSAWGHIFTPIHPCFSLNNTYFKVSVTKVWRLLLWPAVLTALAAWLQIGLLSKIL